MSSIKTAADWKRLFPLPASGKVEGGNAAAATVQALIADLESRENEVRRYDLALQSLTPGGSEFVHDPDRCVAFVQQMRHADFEIIKREKAENAQLRRIIEKRASGTDPLADSLRETIRCLLAALEAEAASHETLATVGVLTSKTQDAQTLARYHREHAAVLRGALAGKTEERVRSELEEHG